MLFKKRLLPKIILLLFGLVAVFSLPLFKKSGFLTIKNIEVKTDFQFQNPKKMEQIFKPYLGKSFFFNDYGQLTKEIKNQEIKIAEVKVKKEFPAKIILEIKGRQPLLAILKDNLYFFIDKEGVVFNQDSTSDNLPFLEMGLQNLKIGSRIEMGKTKIPQILVALEAGKISKIIVKDDEIQLETNEGSIIILPRGVSSSKIEALQMILNRFKIEGKRLTKIDLRFEKPVISF